MILCWSQAKELARIVHNSWVCSKQQNTFSDQSVSIYSKSKIEKVTEFVEKMKKVQKEAEAVLRKV